MTKVTNISDGPRGIWTTEGELVMIEVGKFADLDIEDAEGADAEKTGWFEFSDPLDHDFDGEKGGSIADEPVSLSGKNKAELLEIAAAEEVEIEDGATIPVIKDAIEAKRAAAATE